MTSSSENSFSSRELRDALSAFSTGVTIVTAADEVGEPIGMTASSFNSVSVDPPLILWSVTKAALSANAFRQARHFSVHVLCSDQTEESNRFATAGIDKFGGVDYVTNSHGVPVLSSCSSRFDCSHWACYEGGDHWIIVGHVDNLECNNLEPLVFSSGSYAIASPLRPAPTQAYEDLGSSSAVDELLIYNLARAHRQLAYQFHQAVRESGLTIPEWRILVSLDGCASRELSDLVARTFIEPASLKDMLDELEEGGLCSVNRSADNNEITVVGNSLGHKRIEHLLKLSAAQEQHATGESTNGDLQLLVDLLKTVISNTNTDSS